MNERELGRGIVHVLFGIAFIILIMFDFLKVWHLVFLVLAASTLAFLSREFRVPIVSFCLRNFERRDVWLPGKNFIFFLLGILVVFAFFPKNICLASLAILTFIDPVSHFIGRNFGRISMLGKNIEGHIAGFILGSAFAMMFVKPLLATIGCFFGVLADIFTIKIQEVRIEDDFVIPIVAGLAMVLVDFL